MPEQKSRDRLRTFRIVDFRMKIARNLGAVRTSVTLLAQDMGNTFDLGW